MTVVKEKIAGTYRELYIDPLLIANSLVKKYQTMAEATAACIKNQLTSESYYKKFHQQFDERLPDDPESFYKKRRQVWLGWDFYLGVSGVKAHAINKIALLGKRKGHYETIEEASKASIALGIADSEDYKTKYFLNPRLPRDPIYYYRSKGQKWPGWITFLGKYYENINDARAVCIEHQIKSPGEYSLYYDTFDVMLPSSPQLFYEKRGQVWQGWDWYLGLV